MNLLRLLGATVVFCGSEGLATRFEIFRFFGCRCTPQYSIAMRKATEPSDEVAMATRVLGELLEKGHESYRPPSHQALEERHRSLLLLEGFRVLER